MNKDFIDRASLYFGEDANKFLNLLNEPSNHGFFLNTNKDNKENILEKIDFDYKESLISDNSYFTSFDSIGKTKAYNLGLIYPQDPESTLSASLTNIDNVSLIVDMCASPGGKSINIINKYKDATLISNEINHTRASILSSNLERMGIDNSYVTNMNCSYLSSKLKGLVDLVVLDAPCSGEGMIRKYPEILEDWNLDNILNLSKIQSELLDNAYEMCKQGGYILYSTCTYAFEEDEEQIKDFIKRKNVELIPLSYKYNYSKLDGTIKLCPLNGTEGQFIALLKKNEETEISKIKYLKECKNSIIDKFINNNLNIKDYHLYANKDNYFISFKPLIDLGKGVIRQGIYLGELKKDRLEPAHNLYRANSLINSYKNVLELNDQEYENYIKGLEISTNKAGGYYLLTHMNYQLGFGKIAQGRLKNKYPKGLRAML